MADDDINEYRPDSVSPPGDTLQELLEHLGMSQSELAERTGRPKKTINEIVNGKAAITPETALQLERVLGVPASFWIRREGDYQEWAARKAEQAKLVSAEAWAERFPVSQMVKLGWLAASDDAADRVRQLLRFFGIAHPTLAKKRGASFRRSEAFKIDDHATTAWLQRALNLAATMPLKPFDRDAFLGVIGGLRPLSRRYVFPVVGEVVERCAEAGVAVVHVEELSGTRLSGATLWASNTRAVIALTHRGRRDDRFWFSFFHEAGHVVLHPRDSAIVELENGGTGTKEQEDEANDFARNQLIPPAKFAAFVQRGDYTANAIERFARELEIAPGIVVGRLQKEDEVDWSTKLNSLKRSIDD